MFSPKQLVGEIEPAQTVEDDAGNAQQRYDSDCAKQ